MDKIVEDAKVQLSDCWTRIGLPPSEVEANVTELEQKLKTVVSDAIRHAESTERRMSTEARSTLDSIRRLSSLLCEPLLDERIVALSQRVTADCSEFSNREASRGTARYHRLPLTADDGCNLGSLQQVTELLQRELRRLRGIADARVLNLLALEKLAAVLELPFDEQPAAHAAVVQWAQNAEARNVPPETSVTPERKRLRDDNEEHGKSMDSRSSDRRSQLLRNQDMSLAKILTRAELVSARADELNREIELRVLQESSRLVLIREKLGAAGYRTTSTLALPTLSPSSPPPPPPQPSSQQLVQSSSQREAQHEGGKALTCETASEEHPCACSASVLVEPVRRLLHSRVNADELKAVLVASRIAQAELLSLARNRLQETTVLLSVAYAAYFELTSDPSYQTTPNYGEWATSCWDLDVNAAQHQHDVFTIVQDIERVTSRANSELDSVRKRLAFLQELVLPLMQQRQDILARKEALQHASRDRLFSKKGNMAKVLLEEETLRREVCKTLPKLAQRLTNLAAEWEVMFSAPPLVVRGCLLKDALQKEAGCLTPSMRGPATPPPIKERGDMNVPASLCSPIPGAAATCRSQPTSRGASPRTPPPPGYRVIAKSQPSSRGGSPAASVPLRVGPLSKSSSPRVLTAK